MKITVNSEKIEIRDNVTVRDILKELKYTSWMAVFINRTQVMAAEYESKYILADDNIRILKPLAGG